MEYLSLDEIKEIEFGILQYIVGICEEQNLTYYLSYGSLLGAIRHKGFIPWDDDIDISMPRDDYEKLSAILKRSDSTQYKALLPEYKDYPYHYIKVVDSTTKIIEEEIADYDDMGIWIDIFPLDGVGNKLTARLAYFANKCRAAASYKKCPDKYAKLYWFWYICRHIGSNFFKNMTIKFSRKYGFLESEYVAHIPTAHQNMFPRRIFDELVKIEFCGKYFDAPKNFDEYLSILYNEYMFLPEEEDRQTHCVKAYRITQ